MSTRTLLCITAFTLATLASPAVEATLITGSFSGTASGNMNGSGEEPTPFTTPVTGRFSFETSLPPPEDYCCDATIREPGRLAYQGNLFDFSVHVFGQDTGSAVIGDDWYDSITLLDDGTEQSFAMHGGGPYWYWSMTFVDPDGGMFQNFDPESFDPRQVSLAASRAEFSDDIRAYGAIVSFDTLMFDGYPTSVPEPASLGLFGAGLLLLAGRRRRIQSRA